MILGSTDCPPSFISDEEPIIPAELIGIDIFSAINKLLWGWY